MDLLLSPRRRALLMGAGSAALLVACDRPAVRPADSMPMPGADGGAAGGHRLHLSGSTMGSVFNVRLDPAGQAPQRLAEAVAAALADVERRMSMYRPDSELSALNRAAAGRTVALSGPLFEVLQAAQAVSALSAGAFDVTVAPAVEAWGFGTVKSRRVPSAERVAGSRARLGWRALTLDADRRTATKAHDELNVDLGGIAKGYGVDRVAAALDGLGIAHYMIEVGGEVRTRGLNAEGRPWRIGIEQPDAATQRARHVVGLSGRAMATSGDYRIWFEQDGTRYCHEIDPATGRPVTHRLCSATVVADDCMRADALATALIVLGPERGHALAQAEGIAAQFIERTGYGPGATFRDRMTDAFAALAPQAVA